MISNIVKFRLVVCSCCLAALRPVNAIYDTSFDRSVRALQSNLGQVDRFVLINADTDLPIVDLFNGTIINIATQTTSNFNIQVTVLANSGNIGSIKLGYNTNPSYRIEASAPYAFCGDGGPVGNYYACTNLNTANGQPHIVSATPFSGTKATGAMGVTKAVSFQIVNIPPATAPLNAPTQTPLSAPAKISSEPPTKIPEKSPTKTPLGAPTKTPSTMSTCNIPQFLDTSWSGVIPNRPDGTVEAMGLIVGNDFVTFGGFTDSFSATTNQTHAKDITIANSPYREMDDIPLAVAFTHAPTVRVGMKVYMCGGYRGGHPGPHIASCFVYDHSIPPGNGLQWTRFADLPNNGYAGGGMIYDTVRDALYYASGGQRLVAGSPHPVDSNRAFKYSFNNPSAGWVEIAPIPYKANHLSSVTQTYLGKERHYFVGGQVGEYEVTQNLADIYEFMAHNESWVKRTFMPFGRSHATASTRPLGCGFIIAGGSVNSKTTKKQRITDIHYYDIPSDKWTFIGNLSIQNPQPTPLVDIHANGYMYYVNGKSSNRRRIAA